MATPIYLRHTPDLRDFRPLPGRIESRRSGCPSPPSVPLLPGVISSRISKVIHLTQGIPDDSMWADRTFTKSGERYLNRRAVDYAVVEVD
jgi:hypothetical protein